MNKKIKFSILSRIISFSICLSLLFFMVQCSNQDHDAKKEKKHLSTEKLDSKNITGIWFNVNKSLEKKGSVNSKVAISNIRKIKTLGYLSGYQLAPKKSGVTIYVQNKTSDGMNLVVSGHKPYAALIDMHGNTLHEWTFDYSLLNTIKGELMVNEKVDENFKNYWRRVQLFENGDILAIYDYLGLVKLDKNSKLKWFYNSRAHHDVLTTENGDIWVLTTEKKYIPSINSTTPVFADHICQLSSDGKELKKISVIKCFRNSKYSSYLNNVMRRNDDAVALDILHTNALKMLNGRLSHGHPAFKKGNILISVRELNLLAIIDPGLEKVVWAIEGIWKAQHEPKILKNGNLILFDNKGGGGFSRVLEFNPFEPNKILWSYKSCPTRNFYSPIVGDEQRLDNGNTLITDTVGGKAFEVSSDDKIVWEYVNPYRAGHNKELIAALFEVKRLEKNFSLLWLAPKGN